MSTPTTRYAGTNNMEAASPPLTPIQDPKTDKITTSDVSTVSGDCRVSRNTVHVGGVVATAKTACRGWPTDHTARITIPASWPPRSRRGYVSCAGRILGGTSPVGA